MLEASEDQREEHLLCNRLTLGQMIPVRREKPCTRTPCMAVQKEPRGTHDLGDERRGEIEEFPHKEIGLKENIENGHG